MDDRNLSIPDIPPAAFFRDMPMARDYPPPSYGPVVREPQKTIEINRRVDGGGSEASTGAFYKLITTVSEDADNGDIYLQGGQVSAGTGNEIIDNETILLFDQSADGGAGEWQGAAGEVLELVINGTGSEADGVPMPTFDLTSVTGPTAVASMGVNTLPEMGSLSGVCRVSLGTFTAIGFSPANVGNIQVSFCYGGFTVSRF